MNVNKIVTIFTIALAIALLSAIIYHKYNDGFLEFLYVAEKTMLQKHLDKFLKKGTIEPKNNGYVLV